MIDTLSSKETTPDDLPMTVRQFKNSAAYMKNPKEASRISVLAGKAGLAQSVRDVKEKSPRARPFDAGRSEPNRINPERSENSNTAR